MRFQFKDSTGKVIPLPDATTLMRAIQDGYVTAQTPFKVGDGIWQRAELVAAYRDAEAVLKRLPENHPVRTAPPLVLGRRPANPATAPRLKMAAAAVVLLALAGITVFRLKTSHGRSSPAAALEPPPATIAAAGRLSTDFGASFGRAIRKQQNWVQDQRLDDRVRGHALKSGESVRRLALVAQRMQIEADGLVGMTDVSARRLRARADSMMQAEPELQELTTVLDQQLDAWRDDVFAYAAIRREAATELAALSEWLLARQQSIAIQNNRPYFLNPGDGLRYREMWDRMAGLESKERFWYERTERRHPRWLSGIPEAQRPRFGLPLISRP